jgi:ATP-dependent DNA ligase
MNFFYKEYMASTSVNITDFKRGVPGELIDDITYGFPIIEYKTSSGKSSQYRIIVRLAKKKDGEDVFIPIKDSFYEGRLPQELYGWIMVLSKIGEGKVRNVVPTYILSGKNLGKSNETNVFTQALRDGLSMYNKQMKHTDASDNDELYPPMLAQPLADQSSPVDYNNKVYIQRKYNGVRVVSTLDSKGNVLMYSRARNIYPGFKYIKDELKVLLDGYKDGKLYLDGELYKHGEILQDISGIARKSNKENKINMNYYIYDCFVIKNKTETGLLYSERKDILDKLFKGTNFKYIHNVETWDINSQSDAEELYKRFLKEKYEGAIIRINNPYRFSYNNYHSANLLKMKPVMDEDFKIIGYTEGERGKSKGALLFIVENENGKPFTVTPGLPLEERKRLYRDMPKIFDKKYKGKLLQVLFDEYSKDKIPVRARTVGIVLRDYE